MHELGEDISDEELHVNDLFGDVLVNLCKQISGN